MRHQRSHIHCHVHIGTHGTYSYWDTFSRIYISLAVGEPIHIDDIVLRKLQTAGSTKYQRLEKNKRISFFFDWARKRNDSMVRITECTCSDRTLNICAIAHWFFRTEGEVKWTISYKLLRIYFSTWKLHRISIYRAYWIFSTQANQYIIIFLTEWIRQTTEKICFK